VTHLLGLFHAEFQDFFRAGSERDLSQEHHVVAGPDDLLDLGPHAPGVHAQIGQYLGRHSFAQGDQSQ